jgi:uncharacterized protein YcfJ
MNKSMLLGVVAGVGIATAGGVLGYQFLGQPHVAAEDGAVVAIAAEAPAPAHTQAHTQAPAAAPRATATPQPAAAAAEECWDEEVVVTTDPTDKNRIAGTALGAVVGGAIGKDVGDRDITTAAGAAAGALIGRKIQERIQDNRAEQRTTTTVERRCAPVGTPH